MPEPPTVSDAIGRGLLFLAENQEADGSFISFSSAKIWPFQRLRSWQTVFVPALMLASLAMVDRPVANGIRKKLVKFLLSQKDDNWSFNYWAKAAPEYKTQPYPNDLDDTFCALAGLYLNDSSMVDATALAKIVKLLIASETAPGGPYRTWLVPADSQPVWLDVDVAVNSNIAYFLSLAGNRLPRLNDYMGQEIAKDSFTSPYYPSPYAFIYYFARAYEGSEKGRLLKKTRLLYQKATTDLDRALCLSARLRLGETQALKPEVNNLLKAQRRDGSWPAAGFYADPVKKGKLYYNGAPSLTTAFALEALQLYVQNQIEADPAPFMIEPTGHKKLQAKVLAMARQQSSDLGDDLRKKLLSSLKQVADSSNGPEIIGLARAFNASLCEPLKDPPPSLFEQLGLANLYGWLAYTIYDDFLDEEGRPELISVANAAMRRSVDTFLKAAPDNSEFAGFVSGTFDIIDSANAWESAHCRFKTQDDNLTVGRLPDYDRNISKLAERSLGHVLAPIAVFAAAGKGTKTAEVSNLLKAFRHYLIARQLNDDAHDWQEDLQNGHITIVVNSVLRELKIKPGKKPINDLLQAGRHQFWHSALLNICQLMQEHIKLSRSALKNVRSLAPSNALSDLLDGLDESIKDTLNQQKQAKDFLKQYKRQTRV